MSDILSAAQQALNEGRKPEAAALLIKAITANPAIQRQAYIVLLHLLLDLQQHATGLTWAERASAQAPKDYEFLNLLGAFQRLTGQHKDAIKTFDRAIKLRPAEIAAHVNKGTNYNDMGNGPAAEAIFVKLTRQHPRNAEFQRALARAFTAQSKYDLAEKRLKLALDIDRTNVDAWLDIAALATVQSKHDEALAYLDQAIERLADRPQLYRAKAVALRHAGKYDVSESFLKSLLEKFGSLAWVHYELACSFPTQRYEEAGAHYVRATELAPDNLAYRLALGEHFMRNLSQEPGQNIEQAQQLLATIKIDHNIGAAASKTLSQMAASVADYDRLASLGTLRSLGRRWIEAGLSGTLLDQLARVETYEDRQEVMQQHRLWGDKIIKRAERNPITTRPVDKDRRRIRIGFMSSDLREHPVTYFAWPLFEHVDRDRFDIYCYSFYRGSTASPLQQKLASMVAGFRWHPRISDRDAAQMIADDDLDILFELGGSTYMNKLETMAWKPAPICASWLGYPHSAGLTTIDHLLVDPQLVPPDSGLLLEEPLIMPKTWIAMSDKAFPDSYAIDPVPPVERTGRVSFGTANNSYKYNPAMLRTWAQIVARVPNSRFIFVRPECGSPTFVDNVRRYFEAEGVDRSRVDFRPIRGKHMPHYNDIDITLDTFPQTGGTTTCEAAWMGVPTVTLVGPALFERLSYSILVNMGLGDLCAQSVEEYIDIAVRLSGDVARLRELRATLRSNIRSGPLGQTKQFAADFYDLVAQAVSARRG